jgi:hypothetical protein
VAERDLTDGVVRYAAGLAAIKDGHHFGHHAAKKTGDSSND